MLLLPATPVAAILVLVVYTLVGLTLTLHLWRTARAVTATILRALAIVAAVGP
jgi:hypothetical protein